MQAGFFYGEIIMAYEGKNVETIALHSGWRSDETTGSVAVPIHQTTSFQFNNTCLLYTSDAADEP